MKNVLRLIFFLISAYSFSQDREHYRDSIFISAQDSLKVNNIEKAYKLYSYGSKFFTENQLKITLKKIDSLRPVLRKKLLKNIIGKWNLMSSQYKTKIKSIEIFNDKIIFYEEGDINRMEKIVFENDLTSMKYYSEIRFSDNTKWHLALENEYLTLAYISLKTKNGEITHSDNNDEYVFEK